MLMFLLSYVLLDSQVNEKAENIRNPERSEKTVGAVVLVNKAAYHNKRREFFEYLCQYQSHKLPNTNDFPLFILLSKHRLFHHPPPHTPCPHEKAVT